MAGMCSLHLPGIGGWRDAAIIVSVMGGRPVIAGMPLVHVDFVHMTVILCITHYLNVMPIAFCVKGGKPAQHINHWICTFCSAPTPARTQPVKLFRTFA